MELLIGNEFRTEPIRLVIPIASPLVRAVGPTRQQAIMASVLGAA